MITREQLLALGVRPSTIGSALRRGRLHRVHVGVYSLVVGAARPAGATEQAALLACGGTAALSHHTAARMHGLRVAPAPELQLTVVGDRRRPKLCIHRTQRWERGDLVRVGGLTTTTIARAVFDLSPILSHRPLEHLVDEAMRRVGRGRLDAMVVRHLGRPGSARLRSLLDPERPSSDTWSEAEERLLSLIRRAGLPAPEHNVPIGRYIPDLLWREQRVIVEYDSREYHSGDVARRHDSNRHNEFTAAGYNVLHVTWEQLDRAPERLLVLIATTLARAAG